MSILVGLLVVILLVAASAFFVAVEFSLIAADRSKLEALAADGHRSAKVTVRVLRRLSFHLSGAQLGITLVSLILGFLAKPVIGRLLDPLIEPVLGRSSSSLNIVLALLVATVFQMVAGELIPKNIAISHPEGTAQAMAPLAQVVHGALTPIIVVFNGSANWVVRRLGVEPTEEMEAHRSLDELEYLITSAGVSGALDPESHSLLTRTLRFGDKTAADALTPRLLVKAVPASATVADLAAEVATSRHSRYPVYDDELDNLRGIATITAIFETPVDRREQVLVSQIMREPLVVPETKGLAEILDDFRRTEAQMALVVDEHGGTAGILTLEDVLEELVGDVDDEHDPEPMTGRSDQGVFVVAGTLHPDEIVEVSGLQIPDGDYETIAGFMLKLMGRIPGKGDTTTYNGWAIAVVEMDGLRIKAIRLQAPTPGDDR